jgi:hypothetical protein
MFLRNTQDRGRPALASMSRRSTKKSLLNLLERRRAADSGLLRALAPLQLANGVSATQVSNVIPLTPQAIR